MTACEITCLADLSCGEVAIRTPKTCSGKVRVNAVGDDDEDECSLLDLCQSTQNDREKSVVYDKQTDTERLDNVIQYIRRLHTLLGKEEVAFEVEYKWTSFITATKGKKDFKIRELHQELMMSLAYLAFFQRSNALRTIAADVEMSKLAVQRLRESSGAVKASTDFFDRIRAERPGQRQGYDIPSELCVSMCNAVSSVFLGEAQLVTSFQAQKKNLSKTLVSSLYHGASSFFEKACKTIKGNIGEFNEVPDNLMKYLALMDRLSLSRAVEQMALSLKEEEKIGEAITTFKQSLALLEKCKPIAEDEKPWLKLYEGEYNRIVGEYNKTRKENQIVHFQAETKFPVPPPEAKMVVSIIPFEHIN